jgi:hypothetical protein
MRTKRQKQAFLDNRQLGSLTMMRTMLTDILRNESLTSRELYMLNQSLANIRTILHEWKDLRQQYRDQLQ